jgi:hypothetical protein
MITKADDLNKNGTSPARGSRRTRRTSRHRSIRPRRSKFSKSSVARLSTPLYALRSPSRPFFPSRTEYSQEGPRAAGGHDSVQHFGGVRLGDVQEARRRGEAHCGGVGDSSDSPVHARLRGQDGDRRGGLRRVRLARVRLARREALRGGALGVVHERAHGRAGEASRRASAAARGAPGAGDHRRRGGRHQRRAADGPRDEAHGESDEGAETQKRDAHDGGAGGEPYVVRAVRGCRTRRPPRTE